MGVKKLCSLLIAFILLCLPGLLAQNPGFFFECSPAVQIKEKIFIATFSLIIQPGYFLYSDKINLSGKNSAITRQIWPRAHILPNQRTNTNLSVYPEGVYKISLLFDVPPESESPTLKFSFHVCSTQTVFLPDSIEFPVNLKYSPDIKVAANNQDYSEILRSHGAAWALYIAFFAGLLISFTPCVYPMIPITLSVIGGRGENISYFKGATLSITYVAGLSLVYSLLGLSVAYFGAHVRGFLQGPVFQLLVSLFFALMALSMFDFFAIETPAFIRNKMRTGKTKGYSGVFTLGMLSGLIASPCVAAPLAGILAYIASTGSMFLGFFLLFSFSWGMGLPLILIGTVSAALNSLPKAGDWMITVKEFYAFLLWGTSFYFAQAILGPELNNVRIALFLGALATFVGYFRIRAQSDGGLSPKVIGFCEILLFLGAGAFFLNACWEGLNRSERTSQPLIYTADAKPNETVVWLSDYQTALNFAKMKKLPVLIDFRADWCSICVEMEKNVFPDPQVQENLKNLVLLKIDLSDNQPKKADLGKKMGIVGIPTFIFLNPNGQELSNLRITGGVEAPELINAIKSAKGESAFSSLNPSQYSAISGGKLLPNTSLNAR
ncbi:MAG: protein-disulfide reductase DsbD [Candidatus Riflebacteria bacterium]|nr:protein-disulfide reductase DsbD [Candidatus Riflebacteria bacterium]